MDFLRDRLDRSLFDDADELAFLEAHVGFDALTIRDAQAALRAARAAQADGRVDLSGVVEALEEVLDDLRFVKDPKNAIITWVHKHHGRLEAAVRERFAIEGLMIRAHVDRTHLLVMGTVAAPLTGVEALVEQLSGYPAQSRLTVAGG